MNESDKEAVLTQKGDMRFINGVWWTCTDTDINRWISVGDPSTKEAVRNAALEEAAKVCDGHAGDIDATGKEPQSWSVVRGAVLVTGDMIRALKTTSVSEVSQPDYKVACQEWSDKTEFIQEWMNKGIISVKYLGWHRADIMRDLIDSAYKQEKGK